MRQALAVFLLAFLVFSCLTNIRGEFRGGQSSFSRAAAAEMETVPTDAEHTASPPVWHHPMRHVAKRRKGTLTLISGPIRSLVAADAHPLARACLSSPAVLPQATHLYQSLQVFRC